MRVFDIPSQQFVTSHRNDGLDSCVRTVSDRPESVPHALQRVRRTKAGNVNYFRSSRPYLQSLKPRPQATLPSQHGHRVVVVPIHCGCANPTDHPVPKTSGGYPNRHSPGGLEPAPPPVSAWRDPGRTTEDGNVNLFYGEGPAAGYVMTPSSTRGAVRKLWRATSTA